jgi:outer membrane PBP1 activator LpoA protein
MKGMEMRVIRALVKKAALPAIVLALAASATGCVADTKAEADRREPANAKTVYYHDQVGNSDNDSDNDIETYDRWRQLFGS